MKDENNLLLFFTPGTFSTLPPVNQFYKYFKEKLNIGVIESKIDTYENFFESCKISKTVISYNNYIEYINQSTWIKFKKHFKSLYLYVLIKFKCKRQYNRIYIYTIDLFSLWLSILLKSKGDYIIYHQFEMIIVDELNLLDKFYFKQIKRKSDKIDMVLIPEINRMEYFKSILECPEIQDNFLLLPNSNNNINTIEKIYNNKITITHIGSFGKSHSLDNIIKVILNLPPSKFEFIFVGNITQEVDIRLRELKKSNVKIISQLKHSELLSIYALSDIGLILYDESSLNTKYCAPNKLFEYWSFGIPIIANKLPGLTSIINHPILGSLLDLSETQLVIDTIFKYSSDLDKIKEQIRDIFINEFKLDIYLHEIDKRLNL